MSSDSNSNSNNEWGDDMEFMSIAIENSMSDLKNNPAQNNNCNNKKRKFSENYKKQNKNEKTNKEMQKKKKRNINSSNNVCNNDKQSLMHDKTSSILWNDALRKSNLKKIAKTNISRNAYFQKKCKLQNEYKRQTEEAQRSKLH